MNKPCIKLIAVILCIILNINYIEVFAITTIEKPVKAYTGITNTPVVLKNIDFTDVKNNATWSKEAIYEISALDVMKGYGNKNFGLKDPLTVEQAIALAYRAAGREAEAQQAGEALDKAKTIDQKKTNALSLWADGYLQLATKDGIITAQDLADAFTEDQTALVDTSFKRSAVAKRQDMAFYIAKTLNLAPEYAQKNIFNNFNDWQIAQPLKVPYIEAIIKNNIMNGNGNGNFSPTAPVTREQAAQILKNAEKIILPILKLEQNTGTIESISEAKDLTGGNESINKTFNIRGTDGNLYTIDVNNINYNVQPIDRNEQTGNEIATTTKDLVVYKNGNIGNSNILTTGDKLVYVIGSDNSVKFVNVVSSDNYTKPIRANVNNIDLTNKIIDVSEVGSSMPNSTYRLMNEVPYYVDKVKEDINNLNAGTLVTLTLRDNIAVAIDVFTPNTTTKEDGVINGIVEENNPGLGYITLYNSAKIGTGEYQNSLNNLRVFNYTDPSSVAVQKNGKTASIKDVEPGDSAFLKVDDNGNLKELTAVDNYKIKYSKVVSKSPTSIVIEYDDGTQQALNGDNSIPVILDKKVVTYDTIKDGDYLKLTLLETNKQTSIKEITIEDGQHFITNIYKGNYTNIDDQTKQLVMQNLKKLKNSKWINVDQKGFVNIGISDDYKIISKEKEIDKDIANKDLKGNIAYVAVQQDYGTLENAVMISFKNNEDTEPEIYDDVVSNQILGKNVFGLTQNGKDINYGIGTIVVKNKRLVLANSISKDDDVYVVANRLFNSGNYYAKVVDISIRPSLDFINIYRGRITSLNENEDFTIESFTKLNGNIWEYSNTPKTFKLNYDTRILDNTGVISKSDFISYGDNNFVGKTVYVLSDGINVKQVNAGTYGTINVKGEIFGLDTGIADVTPTQIKIRNTKVFDLDKKTWSDGKTTVLNILKNTIVIKDNKIASPSDLVNGDSVRVIKKDSTQTGDAYIILVGVN